MKDQNDTLDQRAASLQQEYFDLTDAITKALSKGEPDEAEKLVCNRHIVMRELNDIHAKMKAERKKEDKSKKGIYVLDIFSSRYRSDNGEVD